MEKESGKVPMNAPKLESRLRISGLGSNWDGRDPDFRRMEGGMGELTQPVFDLPVCSWVDGWTEGWACVSQMRRC